MALEEGELCFPLPDKGRVVLAYATSVRNPAAV